MTNNSGWTTPQFLHAGQACAFAAALLLMVTIIMGARTHRNAVQAIGKDSVPSIIAAQHIRAALADMDANAANELLGSEGVAAAKRTYDERMKEAVEAIVTAAQNITYGDAERVPIHALALGVGKYSAMMQQARDKKLPWPEASQFMDDHVLPEADKLDKVNRDELNLIYEHQKAASSWVLLGTLLAGFLTMGVLGAVQLFLAQRMRRTLNPALLGATLAALVLMLSAVFAFRAEDRYLKVAKEDAFESIHALWQARSVAYSANGAESRYLLDHDQGLKFEAQAKEVAGHLDDELKNITFAGEEIVAKEAKKLFGDYLRIDQEIRTLENTGRHAEAVALCTGNRKGESNYAFNEFDKALGRTLDVNQRAFDDSVAEGFNGVSGFGVIAPVGAALIALLTWLGLRPRLREYA
jgi:hypothetical protein